MRRGFGIVLVVLVILAGVAIGIGAYNAGVTHGLAQAGEGTKVVRVVGPGYGFFPFGFFVFPLFLFLFFGVARAAFWRSRWRGGAWGGPGHGGPEHWKKDGPAMFDEWHRRQHEQSSGDHPGAGGEPANV